MNENRGSHYKNDAAAVVSGRHCCNSELRLRSTPEPLCYPGTSDAGFNETIEIANASDEFMNFFVKPTFPFLDWNIMNYE